MAQGGHPGQPRLLDRLRDRHGRRAGIAAAGVLLLVVLTNFYWIARNQRELPHDGFREFNDWFRVSPRDIEKVANDAALYTIYGRAGVWYFMGKRIAGAHLTVPRWLANQRWELENVARLEVDVTDVSLQTIAEDDARRLRRAAEKRGDVRRFHRRGHGPRKVKMQAFVLIHDPAASRYVLAESVKGDALFVLSEQQYAAMKKARGEGP